MEVAISIPEAVHAVFPGEGAMIKTQRFYCSILIYFLLTMVIDHGKNEPLK